MFFAVGMTILITVFAICISQLDEDNPLGAIAFLIVVALIGFGCVIGAFITIPSALDVYQGKTELRITYEGQTPVDTTVIYKR